MNAQVADLGVHRCVGGAIRDSEVFGLRRSSGVGHWFCGLAHDALSDLLHVTHREHRLAPRSHTAERSRRPRRLRVPLAHPEGPARRQSALRGLNGATLPPVSRCGRRGPTPRRRTRQSFTHASRWAAQADASRQSSEWPRLACLLPTPQDDLTAPSSRWGWLDDGSRCRSGPRARPRDTAGLAQLRGYLRDDSVSPLALRRLAQRHPDGVDRVFRALLRKPDFSWSRDGEGLMRREKKALIEREPTPSISVVGDRLAELLCHASRRRGVDP
jgi:hypothetical protein